MGNISEIIKGYKVFRPDWTCRPGSVVKQYGCPGMFESHNGVDTCNHGMHFCLNLMDCFNYYSFNPKNHVAEVIAHGQIAGKGDKCCTDKLEIVRELSWQEVLDMVNTGVYNSGYCNTGDRNIGNRNTGNYNTGDCNTGDYNTGHYNTGYYNTGHYNTGNRNTGDYNTGNCNTGNRNTGNRNTGGWNSGDWNTGDWNNTSGSAGCFNTEEQSIMMFNKPSGWTLCDWLNSDVRWYLNQIPKSTVEWVWSFDMTDEEKYNHPEHETTGGYLRVLNEKENAQNWWDFAPEYKRNAIQSLPNFDAKIFEKCTGIKVD